MPLPKPLRRGSCSFVAVGASSCLETSTAAIESNAVVAAFVFESPTSKQMEDFESLLLAKCSTTTSVAIVVVVVADAIEYSFVVDPKPFVVRARFASMGPFADEARGVQQGRHLWLWNGLALQLIGNRPVRPKWSQDLGLEMPWQSWFWRSCKTSELPGVAYPGGKIRGSMHQVQDHWIHGQSSIDLAFL